MMLRFFVAATIVVAVPIAAFTQEHDSNAQPWKPSIEDAQKLVETISGDKDRLKLYCELGKLHEEIEKAEEENNTNDPKVLDGLLGRIASLEQQVGPDYIRVMDGLGEVDPNSDEGQKFAAIFEPLQKQCGPPRVRT
jgi:hypothetical protein